MFNDLPPEILAMIFQKCQFGDLHRIRRVCKRFQHIIQQNIYYINREWNQKLWENKSQELLAQDMLNHEILSEYVYQQHMQLTNPILMKFVLTHSVCYRDLIMHQLDHFKQFFQQHDNANQLTLMIAKFLAKNLSPAEVSKLILDKINPAILETMILETITRTDIEHKVLIDHYVTRHNRINNLAFLKQCLRRLGITQTTPQCLELMDYLLEYMDLDEDQYHSQMNQLLFYGVWRNKKNVIDFAMTRGADYTFNDNVITRLLTQFIKNKFDQEPN